MLKPGVALAYYDPELGRFIQPDTIIPDLSNPQSYNRYSYCVNNPLRYTDPTGHDPAFTPGMSMFEGLTIEQRVAASRTAAPYAVGIGVATITGGAAAPVLVGAGASAGFAAVGSGIIAGTAGDLATQGTQIGLGTRRSINGQEVAVSGLVGGAISGTAAGVSKVLSSAGTPAENPTYEIVDGVRRAKAADLIGNKTIPAQIVDSQSKVVGQGNVAVDALRSPNKSSIDMSSQAAVDRYMRVQGATQSGQKLPPITVTPGNKGVPVKDVQFNTKGD